MSAAATTRRTRSGLLVTVLLLAIAGCAEQDPSTPPVGSSTSSATSAVTPDETTSAPAPTATSDAVVGTVVRFTSDRTSIDVTIGEDSPATRDLLSMLPLELTVEELAGAEKIAHLPRELAHDGSPGSDPEDGDLIYYTPWGNVGFYYDATGIGYSDATLHLGTYRATPDQLALLEGDQVTVDVVP